MHPLCHDEESHALMQFKQSLAINESASSYPSAYPKVASWTVDGDCCSWDGVECDRDSGHVIGLSSSCLYGSINSSSSLFHLVHLRRLNLAGNNFNNSEIPSEIRNLSRLLDLDLSISGFSGQIPAEILELSKLVSIDLTLNSLKLQKPGLQHLVEALTNLEVLHLSGVNISAKLPNLRFLSMRFNPYLTGYLPEFHRGSNLELLLLEGTSFSGHLPESIGNLKSLKEFDVAECEFPSFLSYQNHLELLDLDDNKLEGHIPKWFMNMSTMTLESLSLAGNFLTGFEQFFEILPWNKLRSLNLHSNKLHGSLPTPPPTIFEYETSMLGCNILQSSMLRCNFCRH
ncbi:RECEPTOR-LIKE KINASE FAMILY PROTEIN putative-RELATED [Salix purpurea]|uniref:RECEPTOR-LIKE KINASE FAMILY PROTEIN putative-RELATED n=1 Tax=Salix purpurea TaxID=77065 RepID=A0A9Q0VW31_SALPP|nr:RECEPTOR-LIKE KINASE FAMILY PROTEIN putative-RELATED [Salix purpurea]